MDKSDEKPFVVCVKVSTTELRLVHPDSIKKNCVLCREEVYVMPHNLDKNIICVSCIPEIENAHNEEVEFSIQPVDLLKAQESIDKMKSGG